MIQFKDCTFTLDGAPFQGVSSFLDHAIKNDVRISPEQAGIDLQRAQDMGYTHPAEALNSVNKRLGTKYSMLSEVPDNELKTASKDREAEKANNAFEEYKNSIPEQGEHAIGNTEAISEKSYQTPEIDHQSQRMIQRGLSADSSNDTRERIAKAFDSVKIKEDAAYAVPIPPQVWNAFVEGVKQLVLKGMDVADAIRQGIADLRKQGFNQDEQDMTELELRERVGINDELRQRASQYVLAGRSDAQSVGYLRSQGVTEGVARAILGDAKANPMTKEQRFANLKEAEKAAFKSEDEWLGRKAVNKFLSQQEARKMQARIKDTIPKGKNRNQKANDVDKAIHIYLDLQRNPQHLADFYDKLTPEQQKIVDLSQNLTPEQKQIAADIKAKYDEIGLLAKNNEVIRDLLENYVARAWQFGDKPATEQFSRFKTGTRHSIQRSLDTILEGYAMGYKLAIEGATNNLQALMQEMGNVIENRRLLNEGLKMDYDTGEVDANGDPIRKKLFLTHGEEGYKKIEAPAFQKWEYAGKVEDYDAGQLQAFGRRKDVLLTDNGTVMKKESVYAPEKVAKSLNNILGQSKLRDVPGVNALTKIGREVKFSILSLSGFHYIAFSRVHALVGGKAWWQIGNPIAAYKGGLNLIEAQSPELIEGIQNGLTLSRKQDFDEAVSNHKTWLGTQMDKLQFTKVAKDAMLNLTEVMHKHLFETYGAGLKAFDYVNMFKKEAAANPGEPTAQVAARVAKIINDSYGGINWERMHGSRMQDPTIRHLSSLLLLAPDWTASNLRFAKKAFERGEEGVLYRKAWGRVLLRGAVLTAAANAGLAFMDEQPGEDWEDSFTRRYKEAWAQGNLRELMVDISPLYHWAGGDPGKRAYFSIFGAYADPLKAVSNPLTYLDNKLAWLPKIGEEALTGQDWQGKQFTNADELFGMDDKGVYRTFGHNKKGEYHFPGEEKGGKLEGKLTKYAEGGRKPLTWKQAPSFFLAQGRGMMPIFFQNIWGGAAGENDWTYMLMNAVGTGVVVNKEKPIK